MATTAAAGNAHIKAPSRTVGPLSLRSKLKLHSANEERWIELDDSMAHALRSSVPARGSECPGLNLARHSAAKPVFRLQLSRVSHRDIGSLRRMEGELYIAAIY